MANLDIKKPHDKFFREFWGNSELMAYFLQPYLPPDVWAQAEWEKARQEGFRQGIAISAIKLLKNLFPDLDHKILQMVEELPLTQLEAFFDTALGFQAVEQVHDWLRQHGVQN